MNFSTLHDPREPWTVPGTMCNCATVSITHSYRIMCQCELKLRPVKHTRHTQVPWEQRGGQRAVESAAAVPVTRRRLWRPDRWLHRTHTDHRATLHLFLRRASNDVWHCSVMHTGCCKFNSLAIPLHPLKSCSQVVRTHASVTRQYNLVLVKW